MSRLYPSVSCLYACRLLPWLTNFIGFSDHVLGGEFTAIDTLSCVLHTAFNKLFVELDSKLEAEKMVQNHRIRGTITPEADMTRAERHGTEHGY